MVEDDPPPGGTTSDPHPFGTWLIRTGGLASAERDAHRKQQRAYARMRLRYLRSSFQRLERETRELGHRANATATAGVVACVVLPMLLLGVAAALCLTGVAHPFGLSESALKVLGAALPMLPAVFFGLYKAVCGYLKARHHELREEEARYLACAAAMASGVPHGSVRGSAR